MKRKVLAFSVTSKLFALVAAVSFAVAVTAIPAAAQDGEQALVRVANLSPDTGPMDVYIDDQPAGGLSNISYKDIPSYLTIAAGTHNIKVYPAGDTSRPLLDVSADLNAGNAYTLGVVGLTGDGSLGLRVYQDGGPGTAGDAPGDARLRVIHASPDAGVVNLATRDEQKLFVDLGFPNATRYAKVPAGSYAFKAVDAATGAEVFSVPTVSVSSGSVYSAFVVGLKSDRSLRVIVAEDTTGASGELQVSAFLPDTGGMPTLPLLLGAGFIVAGAALRLRRKADVS